MLVSDQAPLSSKGREPDVVEFVSEQLLQLLLHNGGSTTAVVEGLVGRRVDLRLRYQAIRRPDDDERVPMPSRDGLLWRLSTLELAGEALSDNVVWADLTVLPDEFARALFVGRTPIGRILARYEHRREPISAGFVEAADLEARFAPAELPAGRLAMKEYRIWLRGVPALYLCEVFRPAIIACFWRRRFAD